MLFSCAKSFEKRKQPTPNMVTILAATSTVVRKGLKPLMKDQVKRVGGEAIGQEGDGRPPIKDKGKNKVEEVPKKKQRFFAVGERGPRPCHHFAPKSPPGKSLWRPLLLQLKGAKRGQSWWSLRGPIDTQTYKKSCSWLHWNIAHKQWHTLSYWPPIDLILKPTDRWFIELSNLTSFFQKFKELYPKWRDKISGSKLKIFV